MKKETKQKIFEFIIYIIENFYTEDFSYLVWWGFWIFYPAFILKNIFITPILILLSPIVYFYFIKMNKIKSILKNINIHYYE